MHKDLEGIVVLRGALTAVGAIDGEGFAHRGGPLHSRAGAVSEAGIGKIFENGSIVVRIGRASERQCSELWPRI